MKQRIVQPFMRTLPQLKFSGHLSHPIAVQHRRDERAGPTAALTLAATCTSAGDIRELPSPPVSQRPAVCNRPLMPLLLHFLCECEDSRLKQASIIPLFKTFVYLFIWHLARPVNVLRQTTICHVCPLTLFVPFPLCLFFSLPREKLAKRARR